MSPTYFGNRLIAWFSHSPIVLRGADHGFYRRFLKSIALQTRYLRHVGRAMPGDATRFKAGSRLRWQACACRQAVRAGSGGGPQSRSAKSMPRSCRWRACVAQSDGADRASDGSAAAQGRPTSISDRSRRATWRRAWTGCFRPCVSSGIPMASWCCSMGLLRFPRTGLLGVLRYDETSGSAFREMPHSQYQTAVGRKCRADCRYGTTTEGILSNQAHAGCLSFELSSGRTASSSMPALRWCRIPSMRILPG
jgi:hypothetical protein